MSCGWTGNSSARAAIAALPARPSPISGTRPRRPVPSARSWRILRSPIERPRYVAVQPQLVSSRRLTSRSQEPFVPDEAENVALHVRDQRPCDLLCDTYDLGQIALHRFEFDSGAGA